MRTIIGVERIHAYDRLFRGKRIGLITNFTGISPDWTRDTVEIFMDAGYEIAKIFTPEHGLYGAEAGEKVDDSRHPRYRIPVLSLYGDRRTPGKEDLEGLDLLVYDIQDVGLRYYTYIYTMCYALGAAADAGIPYVILDRPDPLGGRVCGARIRPDIHSFVGDLELPMRYGLTIGEMAGYYLKYTGRKADLTVVTMENYSRDMLYPDTGLLWNTPSPALPTFKSAVCYSGGCLFESLNISEGRGSGKPFQVYGAPFIDMDRIYRDVREIFAEDGLDDGSVCFRRRSFVPSNSKYRGELCFGLEFAPLRADCDFLPAALALIKAIVRRYPDKLEYRRMAGNINGHHLTVLSGNEWAEEYVNGRLSMAQLKGNWQAQREEFEAYVADVKIYR